MSDELLAFLCSQIDHDERVALAASRTVADRHYPPADVTQEHVAAGGRWQSKPWQFNAKVVAEDVREYWRDEGPQVIRPGCWSEVATHAALHDPARILREVEAKRRRLERHEPLTSPHWPTSCRWCGRDVFVAWPCPDILDDVQGYADRPGFREQWRAV